MPRRDGTGPQGFGALTGRAMGRCNSPYFQSNRYNWNRPSKEELLREKVWMEERVATIERELEKNE